MSTSNITYIAGLYDPTNRYPTLSTEEWKNALENAGPQLRQWRLKQYSHCKCKGGKEHEFLKLKFLPVESRDEITVIVYVERAAEQKLGTVLAVSATGSSQVSSMSSQVSSGSHLASVKTTAAFDSISYFTEDSKRQRDWVKAKLGKYNILQTFTYESIQGPPVLYLSFLFYAVTLREKHYSLMEGQCYWYASAASANLQNIFPTENIEDQENLRTKGTRMGVHIPISNEFKTEVREQYDEFKKKYDDKLKNSSESDPEQAKKLWDDPAGVGDALVSANGS